MYSAIELREWENRQTYFIVQSKETIPVFQIWLSPFFFFSSIFVFSFQRAAIKKCDSHTNLATALKLRISFSIKPFIVSKYEFQYKLYPFLEILPSGAQWTFNSLPPSNHWRGRLLTKEICVWPLLFRRKAIYQRLHIECGDRKLLSLSETEWTNKWSQRSSTSEDLQNMVAQMVPISGTKLLPCLFWFRVLLLVFGIL